MAKESDFLLEVKNLVKEFPIRGGFFNSQLASVKAVGGVSFQLKKGETLGLVGESGCGKTTLGRCLLRLIAPSSGEVWFQGQNILELNADRLRQLRKKMQIIFQDPYASLNPRMTIGGILTEPLLLHGLVQDRHSLQKRLKELLEYVQLSQDSLNKYPHEFSGGQRQRVCIARALAVAPEFIVCDEPVSALDVSVQAQVINLLMDLQKELNLTYLFIAHDLKVVEFISQRVAVMYLGHIVEIATPAELYGQAKHPYTKALFSAIPNPDPTAKKDRIILEGDIPSPVMPPSGCHFHPRCYRAIEKCRENYPELSSHSLQHQFRCHNPLS